MIQLCLTDPQVGGVQLRNAPTYMLGQLCFACVFLVQVAAKRRDGLVDVGLVSSLSARLVQQLRQLSVSMWHPAYAVADMLERITASFLSLGSGKGREIGTGSRRASTIATEGTGGMMEEAVKRALSLFPDTNMSVIGTKPAAGGSTVGGGGGGGDGGGDGGGPSTSVASLDSPGLGFETPNFFDFGGGSQSGQGGL